MWVKNCKGKCIGKNVGRGKTPFEDGKKKCGACEYYTYTEDIFCFCCGSRFRTRPIVCQRGYRTRRNARVHYY